MTLTIILQSAFILLIVLASIRWYQSEMRLTIYNQLGIACYGMLLFYVISAFSEMTILSSSWGLVIWWMLFSLAAGFGLALMPVVASGSESITKHLYSLLEGSRRAEGSSSNKLPQRWPELDSAFVPKLAMCICMAFFWWVWPTVYRYDHLSYGSHHIPIRTNRLSNETYMFGGKSWVRRPDLDTESSETYYDRRD